MAKRPADTDPGRGLMSLGSGLAPGVLGGRPAGPYVGRSRFRVPSMVALYLGLLVGAVVLARTPETYFERFWWLAPLAAISYVALLSLTVASRSRGQQVANQRRDELLALEQTLRRSLQISAAGRRCALLRLFPGVREVQAASRRLSVSEREALRQALVGLDVVELIESDLRHTRRKGRRAEALFALGWLADERSIPTLAAALAGRDADLAYVAGQALAEFECAQACECLVQALRTECISRPLAATLLESSRYRSAPELIASAREDRDPQVRSWVAYLLGRSGSAEAPAWLASLACDPVAEVRASAAEALGACPDPVPLAALLCDGDWQVRASAAKAVGHAGLEGLAENLTPLLRDRVWWVRQSAALALKLLGEASVKVLRPMLEDENRFARSKAAEILIELGYVSSQVAMLGDSSPQAATASRLLAAVLNAGARATIEGFAGAADPTTRKRLRALLDADDPRVAVGEATPVPQRYTR